MAGTRPAYYTIARPFRRGRPMCLPVVCGVRPTTITASANQVATANHFVGDGPVPAVAPVPGCPGRVWPFLHP